MKCYLLDTNIVSHIVSHNISHNIKPIVPSINLPPPPKNMIPEQIGIRMVPSIKDLHGALKKLKPIG